MQYHHHVIENVPAKEGLWGKVKANVLFTLGITKVTNRAPLLMKADYDRSVPLLKKGDVVVTGSLRRLSKFVLGGPVTHSLLYIGDGECVHAIGDGVESIPYKTLFSEYDTLAVLRPNIDEEQVNSTVAFAVSKIGMPFDYSFDPLDDQTWFCSELVLAAYHRAGVKTCFSEKHDTAIYPVEFLRCVEFEMIFHSRTLKKEQGSYIFAPEAGYEGVELDL